MSGIPLQQTGHVPVGARLRAFTDEERYSANSEQRLVLRCTRFIQSTVCLYPAISPFAQLFKEKLPVPSSPARQVPFHKIKFSANRVRDQRLLLPMFRSTFVNFRACSCQSSLCNKLATSQSALEFELLRMKRVTVQTASRGLCFVVQVYSKYSLILPFHFAIGTALRKKIPSSVVAR